MFGELVIVLQSNLQLQITGGTFVGTKPGMAPFVTRFNQLGAVFEWSLPRSVALLPPLAPLHPPLHLPVWSPSQFVTATHPTRPLDELARDFRALPGVVGAYVAPPAAVRRVERSANATAFTTQSFASLQGYLESAPDGLGAVAAWTRGGGKGAGVQIFDVEYGWELNHVELDAPGHVGPMGNVPDAERDHGTAVAGILVGAHDGQGVSGFCPDGVLTVAPIRANGTGIAKAIDRASAVAKPGDVLVIELAMPGPAVDFQPRADQGGDIPVEWWPHIWTAIRTATAKGVVVVAAAGNGEQDLGDALYDQRPSGFPSNWENPFRRAHADSGSIVVGGGLPPATGMDRVRWVMSNWGPMLDAQGWALNVVTSGYGDLAGDTDETRAYTKVFGGTSAATAMVAGAVASLQGTRRGANARPLTPHEIRAALRETGSPQQARPHAPLSQRIGSRPDLAALLAKPFPP